MTWFNYLLTVCNVLVFLTNVAIFIMNWRTLKKLKELRGPHSTDIE